MDNNQVKDNQVVKDLIDAGAPDSQVENARAAMVESADDQPGTGIPYPYPKNDNETE